MPTAFKYTNSQIAGAHRHGEAFKHDGKRRIIGVTPAARFPFPDAFSSLSIHSINL
jgi:hypothetical protein